MKCDTSKDSTIKSVSLDQDLAQELWKEGDR